MPATVIGVYAADLPLPLGAVYVEIQQSWDSGWAIEPELELRRCVTCAAGQDLGSCEISRRYGRVKAPFDSTFVNRIAWNLDGYWVRIMATGDYGTEVAWVGQISGERREIAGNSVANSGVQKWIAYAPLQILRKIHIVDSYWEENENQYTIGWLPTFNKRDQNNRLVGNRSTSKSATSAMLTDSYTFGGNETWTRYDILEYVVERHLNVSVDEPRWSLGGQVDLLADLTDSLKLSKPVTVAQAVRQIIDQSLGIDYKIIPTDEGFEIFVYALIAEEIAFGSVTLPRNPNTVSIALSGAIDGEEIIVVKSSDRQYGKIRVTGQRIVQCATLSPIDETFGAKWTSTLETEYKGGTGSSEDLPFEHDAARAKETLRPVYQQFGIPVGEGWASPALDTDGIPTSGTADVQTTVRETLPWLPLREGHDYSEGQALDLNPANVVAGQLPPAVWFWDDEYGRYVPADKHGIAVSVLPADWGVMLSAVPNHRLAREVFDVTDADTEQSEYDYNSPLSDQDRYFDYRLMLVTIAWRLDQTLSLSYDVPGVTDATVMEIVDPEAELWLLAANTAVDIDTTTGMPLWSGSTQRVLRNDSSRLALRMAGAIARYGRPRGRASIVLKGIRGWSDLVGQILTVVDEAGDMHDIQSPISSVEIDMSTDPPTTVIKAGNAR